MTPALLLEAAALGYANAPPALRGVRIRIARGERVAVLGGNGAGKSALLRAAVGLAAVNGGRVEVHGNPVRAPEEAVRAGAALALQNPEDQLLGTTVLDDAMIGPRHAGLEPDAARARARHAIVAVGLAGFEDRAPERLSFGEKRRAGLAAVLAMDPTLLLLDEPTAGLDPAGELELAALVARLARERGAAVVVATHAVDLVTLLADRAIVLGEGRVLADGPVADVFADPELLARARLRAPWLDQAQRGAVRAAREGHLPSPAREVACKIARS